MHHCACEKINCSYWPRTPHQNLLLRVVNFICTSKLRQSWFKWVFKDYKTIVLFHSAFNCGIGQESREITIRKAKHGITALCQQLRLNQQCIDIACNFFKLALSRHLTKGRPASHIHAACVYITCRTEGTARILFILNVLWWNMQ